MEMSSDEDFCRLCAEARPLSELLPVADSETTKQDLKSKISQLFKVRIEAEDRLPKSVCRICRDKVNFTWDFNERIQQSQEALGALYFIKIEEHQIALEENVPEPTEKRRQSDLIDCFNQLDQHTKIIGNLPQTNEDIVDINIPHISTSPSVENVTHPVDDLLPVIETEQLSPAETQTEPISHQQKSIPAAKKNSCKLAKVKQSKRKANKPLTQESVEIEENLSDIADGTIAERQVDGSLLIKKDLQGWNSYPWLCIDCDTQLSSMVDLKSHYQNAHNTIPKFMCVDCPKVYTKYFGFISHVRTHRNHLKLCCDCCGNFFFNKRMLETHRATHFEAKPFTCKTCGKSFKLQSALYVHSRSHLPQDIKNKYPCDQCSKKFATRPNLMAHQRIHSGVREFTCDQCGKSFVQKGNLENHLLTHTAERPFMCKDCGKTFKTPVRLKKHETVHSGVKPYKCDVCGRAFRERGTLKEHHRIHTGAMPFSCEYCGKHFRFKGVLTTHRRLHTGERPYSCLECQHHFTNWPNYNKHMKRRHGINTSQARNKDIPTVPTKDLPSPPAQTQPHTPHAPSELETVYLINHQGSDTDQTTTASAPAPPVYVISQSGDAFTATQDVGTFEAQSTQMINYYTVPNVISLYNIPGDLISHQPG